MKIFHNSHCEVVHEAFPSSWPLEKVVDLGLHGEIGVRVPRPCDAEAVASSGSERGLPVRGHRGGGAGEVRLLEQGVGGGKAGGRG